MASNQSILLACADTVGRRARIPAIPEDSIEPLFGPQELLDGCFPQWRVWASWRPIIQRLESWQQISISRWASLMGFMALEGPEFSGQGKKTLRDGLIQRSSNSSQHRDMWWKIICMEVRPGMGDWAEKWLNV